jgi:hypothetical protein
MFARTDIWRDPSFYALRSVDLATRMFAWKVITRTLPTLTAMRARRPDIFTSDQCPLCPDTPETGEHVLLHCPTHSNAREDCSTQLDVLLRTHDPNRNTFPWYIHHAGRPTYQWETGPIAAGLIPTSLQPHLSHLNSTCAINVTRKANQIFIGAFKAIWASRCIMIRQ